MRQLLAQLYDEPYKMLKDLYGSSNDYAGEAEDGGDLPPFQSNVSREPRPYLQPTEFDDSGFRGLEPPVG